MTVSFYTLGCKVNQYESTAVCENFKQEGYKIVAFNECSDVVVINTCAVTEESARKSRQIIRRARKNNPLSVIVVMGCLSQLENDTISNNANIIIGSDNKTKIPELVNKYINEKKNIIDISDISKNIEFEKMSVTHGDHTRAQVKIQDGCNNFCSYCIIPYTRGRIRSKSPEDAYKEIYELVKNGYKEIVLTGIHLDSYGKESGEFDIFDLLNMIQCIDGLKRIRLGSLEPVFINISNIKKLKVISKLCPQFHLSLQSGCDSTLKRMNRHYTTSDYANAVSLLRDNYPECAITTDVIVGFPGETEAEFELSKQFVEKISFAKVHVFPFSQRKGTPAYSMQNQIDNNIKKLRSKTMISAAMEGEKLFYKNHIGKKIDVLFEQSKDKYTIGHAADYSEVRVAYDDSICKKIVKVYIDDSYNDFCKGHVIIND